MSEELGAFKAQVTRLLGLEFETGKDPGLIRVLHGRAASRRLAPADYIAGLNAADPEEIGALARRLTVNETYFFRNPGHFEALAALMRGWAQARPLRVLSAACASGEEAYSIAITALRLGLKHVRIQGVDIDPDALARAQSATYSRWSLRQTAPEVCERYFEPVGARYRLIPTVRALVEFRQLNLVDPRPDFWAAGSFDVIFCRNALMYFDVAHRTAALHRMEQALAPGGHLFLGHAETLRGLRSGIESLEIVQGPGSFHYRRRGAAEPTPRRRPAEERVRLHTSRAVANPLVQGATAAEPATAWYETIIEASARVAALDHVVQSQRTSASSAPPAPVLEQVDEPRLLELLRLERHAEAADLLTTWSSEDPRVLLWRALTAAQLGRYEAARDHAEQLLVLDDLDAGARFVLGLCAEQVGTLDEAATHYEAAGYLESDFALPHLHLGMLARQRGDGLAAQRALARARALLAGEDAARIVLYGGGFDRSGLLQLCEAELRACGGVA